MRSYIRWAGLALVLLAIDPARADAPPAPRAPRDFAGVWAGERMGCVFENRRLITISRRFVRLPQQYPDTNGYVCRVTRVTGRQPRWTLAVRCSRFGAEPRGERPGRLEIELRAAELPMVFRLDPGGGDEPWEDELGLCRPWAR